MQEIHLKKWLNTSMSLCYNHVMSTCEHSLETTVPNFFVAPGCKYFCSLRIRTISTSNNSAPYSSHGKMLSCKQVMNGTEMLNKMKLGSNSQTVNLTKMDTCMLELANRFEKKLFTAGVYKVHVSKLKNKRLS